MPKVTRSKIFYRKRSKLYKYVLAKEYRVKLPLPLEWFEEEYSPGSVEILNFALLERDGTLTIRRDYSWDGPSGPTVDTKNSMRASLVHDVLYQMMREGKIPRSLRKHADEIYRKHLIEDGMSHARARVQYSALRVFGGRAARKKHHAPTLSAP